MPNLVLFNKPYQVLSQFTDNSNRKTLADFINAKDVYPAGRLDYDSEGLLLLTDDGKLQQQISNPRFKMAKTYWVQVEGEPNSAAIADLCQGIKLNDGPTKPAKVSQMSEPDIWARTPPIRERKNSPTHWLSITITEGRNRQVRRMTAAVGLPTLRLIRSQIGPWNINQLRPGESRIEIVNLSVNRSPDNQSNVKRKRSNYRDKPRRS